MAKAANEVWTVLAHEPMEQLEEGLWRVEGSLPNMPLRRVMTVARLASGDLLVHNPIAVDASTLAAIDALGRVGFIVVPNGWHRLDVPAFRARYANARVLAPRGSIKKVAEIAPGVVDLAALPSDPNVSLDVVDGTNGLEAVMTVKANGGVSVVLADAVFNMPHLTGLQGFVLRNVTGSSGGPRVSRVARLLLIKDKAAFAAHLRRLATSDLRRVLVAHHQTIADDPAGALRRVAASVHR
ncbi:MAG: DUF4336 domain-containing protein [Myxococcota bacterium]|nr:DUF4336 domain-containing protein [Myxococcota bacterium]